jgi:hypothetical protein
VGNDWVVVGPPGGAGRGTGSILDASGSRLRKWALCAKQFL